MKKVLLTGAAGFIGRHCLPLLSARGYEIHAVSTKGFMNDQLDIHWHKSNLLNSRDLWDLMATVRPSHLLHLAWYTLPVKYWTSLENICWVQSGLELIRAFVTYGGERAVMAGTCAEYDWRYGYCSEIITPCEPSTLYGTCKHSLQIMLDAIARQAELSTAWGRIFFLYGPHEHPDRLVPSVISSLLLNKQAQCTHGNQIRDFLYVRDVADAFVALLGSDVEGPVNIASGRPVLMKDIIQKIANRLARQDLIQLGAIHAPANEPPLLLADVRRLNTEVRWEPKYDLDLGLDETISWWKNQLLVRK